MVKTSQHNQAKFWDLGRCLLHFHWLVSNVPNSPHFVFFACGGVILLKSGAPLRQTLLHPFSSVGLGKTGSEFYQDSLTRTQEYGGREGPSRKIFQNREINFRIEKKN